MPIYARVCEECKEENDFLESVQFADVERMETRCPSCGKVTWHKKVMTGHKAYRMGKGRWVL